MKNLIVLLMEGYAVHGIYDSEQDMIDHLKEDWGDEDLTVDSFLDNINEYDMSIAKGTYYPSKSSIRDEKIEKILE